jgi:transposase
MYIRISAAAASRESAARVLDTQEKASVYSKMDGNTPQTKIETMTGVPRQTIGRWADEFVEAGLASPPNEYYQGHKALFSLAELGINLAILKKRSKVAVASASTETSGIGAPTTGQGEAKTDG